jgi:hypothetical protein
MRKVLFQYLFHLQNDSSYFFNSYTRNLYNGRKSSRDFISHSFFLFYYLDESVQDKKDISFGVVAVVSKEGELPKACKRPAPNSQLIFASSGRVVTIIHSSSSIYSFSVSKPKSSVL